MADTKQGQDTKKDAKGDGEKPLENPKIGVEVVPADGNKSGANKVKEKIKKDLADAITKHADDGAKKQLDAADKVIDDAKRGVSPRTVKEIKTDIKGDVDGDAVERKRTVRPKGG